MKATRKTVLAGGLMLIPGLAHALGLGAIDVKSGLNQPLNAEIQVIQASAGEASELAVDLAKAEDFARVGIDRSRIAVPLEFEVTENSRGDTVIKVTSTEPVREPYLSFLLDVNWSKGRLLREYTVLLDPPVMASARSRTGTASAPAPRVEPAPKPEPLRPVKPEPTTPAPAVTPAPAAQAAPPPAPTPTPAPVAAAPAPTPAPAPAPAPAAAPGDYGPVSSGETLWEVALATKPEGVEDMNKLLLTLLKLNPDAFYEDNVNALKRGAVLRIPSPAEVNAISAAEAKLAMAEQNEIWRGYQERAAGRTTSVADAGSSSLRAASAGRPGSSADSRLELVPPRASTGDQGGADRPGSGGMNASSSAVAEVRADLARAEEDLVSARQEASELRSRVADLEKIKTDQERLLSLRDNELAALKKRIAALEAKEAEAAAIAAAAPPPSDDSATPMDDVPADDVAVDDSSTVSADDTPPADDGSVTSADIWGSTDTPTDDGVDPLAADDVTDDVVDDGMPTSDDSAMAADDPTTPPAVTQPVSDPVAATPQPVEPPPPAKAWWENYYILGGAGAAVLALLAFFATRRKKEAHFDAGADDHDSAVDFGIPAAGGHDDHDDDHAGADPLFDLRSRISDDPSNLDAHLDLLRFHYGRGESDAFEQAAEAMLVHVQDQHGPEWREARSLGEGLLPGNPLFAEPHDFGSFDATETEQAPTQEQPAPAAEDDTLSFDSFDEPAPAPAKSDAVEDLEIEVDASMSQPAEPAAPAATSGGDDFDFEFDFDSPTQTMAPLQPREEATPEPEPEPEPAVVDEAPSAAPEEEEKFELDLPPLDFDFNDSEVKAPDVVSFDEQNKEEELSFDLGEDVAESVSDLDDDMSEAADQSEEPADADDDGFDLELDLGAMGDSDAVGTKLDLARAYIDMGDPDGARSMLEEVIAEGNAGQRSEAEGLMATLD